MSTDPDGSLARCRLILEESQRVNAALAALAGEIQRAAQLIHDCFERAASSCCVGMAARPPTPNTWRGVRRQVQGCSQASPQSLCHQTPASRPP